MILVDTSIWIDHLRRGSPALAALLQTDAVCTHDFVIGELACGNLRKHAEVLSLLQSLRDRRPPPKTKSCSSSNSNRSWGAALATSMPTCSPPP